MILLFRAQQVCGCLRWARLRIKFIFMPGLLEVNGLDELSRKYSLWAEIISGTTALETKVVPLLPLARW